MRLLSEEMGNRLALLFLRTRHVTGKEGANQEEILAVLDWANEIVVMNAFLQAVLAQLIMVDLREDEIQFLPYVEDGESCEYNSKLVQDIEKYVADMFHQRETGESPENGRD